MIEEENDFGLNKSLEDVDKYIQSEKDSLNTEDAAQEPSDQRHHSFDEEPPEEALPEESREIEIDSDIQRDIFTKKQLSKLKRERYRLSAEAQKLKEENEALRQYMEHSSQAAMTHYDNNVQLRIDTAKKEYLKALEVGDMEAAVEYSELLSKAAAEQTNNQSWKAQEQIRRYNQQHQQQEQEYYDEPDIELNAVTEEWIAQNPWFDPNNPKHIPEIFEDVNDYISSLDDYLVRTGKLDQRFTKQYFNKINSYVNETHGIKPSQYKAPIQMKTANRYVEPVRNTNVVSSTPKKQKITLSPEDRAFVRNLGVSEEVFSSEVKKDIEKQKNKGAMYGYR